MAFLSIQKLRKSYGKVQILQDVSLEIERGAFISLLGASGSGKTTILRCLAGLEKPDDGIIQLGETVFSSRDVFMKPEKRQLGMVFQNYAVWPHMSVADNVAFPLRMQGMADSECQRKVQEAIALVKMTGLEKRFAHELSGGQQQRVALARALVMSPQILLLDEPLSNLDAILREELGLEIRRLQKSLNLTTILVTHDQKEALSLSDQVILLDKGEIVARGSPEELYVNPPSVFAAEFLAGAQRVKTKSGEEKIFIPRRWHLQAASAATEFCLVSRIFLGNEYEYLAESPSYAGPIRFFSEKRLDLAARVALEYRS